jgi:group I intron endonuclease
MTYGIIYKATGPGGKVYIGQTRRSLADRQKVHKHRATPGHGTTIFQLAISKHGWDSFTWEQIDTAESQAELNAKEKQWIATLKSNDPKYGYNCTDGGSRFVVTEEIKQKLRSSHQGPKPWLVGKHLSGEHRKKLSDIHKGMRPSEETRKRMSEAHKGHAPARTKITEETARNIKIDLENGMRNCDICKKYNVSRGLLDSIKKGSAWAWVVV